MKHMIKTSLILATILLGVVFSQGSGKMRSGNKPNGPSNLPPQEPGITDKLANVTDSRLVNLKNILQYLPPVEQDLIADCSASNVDATRLVSPDCYKSNFTGVVRLPQSKGFSDMFTNSSKSNREGLGCLKKIADVFGNSTDSTTSTINSDVSSAVAQQIPFNQATSTFITTVLNVLNTRRKYFLTTSNVLIESISGYDANGLATGFVFNKDDQKTIVSAFRVYTNFVYNYFSTLNTKVSNIQGLVGQLNACQPQNTTTTTLRFLDDKNNTRNGTRPSGSEPGPSGKGPKGGKNNGKDGRPRSEIPQNIELLTSTISSALASKTGAWATLRTEILANLVSTSGYKPNGGLMRSILQRVNSEAYSVLNKEFSKFKRSNETCVNDYLYYCRDGVCACAESNCPVEVSAIKTITLASSVQSTFQNKALRYLDSGNKPPQIEASDFPSAYLICSVCLSGKRYTYAQATFPVAGNLIDFADASGNGYGRENNKLQNDCANALATGTSDQKVKCRGEMNDDCGRKMDKACGATGLYNFLVNNPLPQSALPAVCDDTLSSYSETNCFNWLAPKITRATIVFNQRGFNDLPRSIASSFSSARMMQSDSAIKVVDTDPVQLKDSTANIPSSIAFIDSNEISVDGATVTNAPSATDYMNQLAQTTGTVNLGESFVKMSFSFFLGVVFVLLI